MPSIRLGGTAGGGRRLHPTTLDPTGGGADPRAERVQRASTHGPRTRAQEGAVHDLCLDGLDGRQVSGLLAHRWCPTSTRAASEALADTPRPPRLRRSQTANAQHDPSTHACRRADGPSPHAIRRWSASMSAGTQARSTPRLLLKSFSMDSRSACICAAMPLCDRRSCRSTEGRRRAQPEEARPVRRGGGDESGRAPMRHSMLTAHPGRRPARAPRRAGRTSTTRAASIREPAAARDARWDRSVPCSPSAAPAVTRWPPQDSTAPGPSSALHARGRAPGGAL